MRLTTTSRPRKLMRLALLPLLSIVALMPFAAEVHAAETCPNSQAREQNSSTTLADCRAYEMVSPLDKNGGDIAARVNNGGLPQASPNGEAITYASLTSFGAEGQEPQGGPSGSQYLSTHGAQGWSTQNITVPLHTPESLNNQGTPYKAFSSNLSEGLLFYPALPEEPGPSGSPETHTNYYLRNFSTAAVQPLVLSTPPGVENFALELKGVAATPDLNHVILRSTAALTQGATQGAQEQDVNLYESSRGALEAVNVPPNPGHPGETLPEATIGTGQGNQTHTISEDGSRVFWSTHYGGVGTLYAREGLGTPAVKTVQVDEGIGGAGVFLTASADGSKVFFTKENSNEAHLYEFNLETEHLSNLTPQEPVEEASVVGVLGSSADGSYIYYVAQGTNLYVWHEGAGVKLIATLAGSDSSDWSPELWNRTARVTPDGRHIVFDSEAELTGYNSTSSGCGGGPCEEVFSYEYGAAQPVCISCNPSGTPPLGASSIPGGSVYAPEEASYASRALSDAGDRVFFTSNDSLTAADTNTQQDVYEWEQDGTGSCEQAPGCINLISSGTSNEASTFLDASADGTSVFFLTRQQLAAGDTDQETDVYDAREDGGIARISPPACTGTGCQGTPAATPIFATPATQTFEGVGNLPAPPKVIKVVPLTKAQKLAKALKTCAKKPRKQRASCIKQAHKRYPAAKKKAKKSRK